MARSLLGGSSIALKPEDIGEETYKGDRGDPQFTKLLDDALRCAIVPCRHDPVVSPPNIEDTPHGLEEVEHKKGNLSHIFNEPSKGQPKNS